MIVPNIPFVISQPDIVNSSSTAASKMDKHESEKRITQRPFKVDIFERLFFVERKI